MTSTAAAAAAVQYEPRRSNKIQDDVTPADGDTWEEKLVVCEAAGGKLVIRSYFRNTRTRQREWDEPPSGASKIEPASPAERHDAEEELKTLQAALPAESVTNNASSNGKKKKVGFFSAFKKKDGTSTGGRTFFGGKKKTINNNATAKNTTRRNQNTNRDTDEDLQRAISASMGLMDQNTNENNNTTEEQEQLDMAKAISMSMMAENANNTADFDYNNSNIEEDEEERRMIEQALQASRETSTGVAMAAQPMIDFSSNHEASVSQFDFQQPRDYDDDFFNQKMPAQNYHNKKLPPSGFDPFAPQEVTPFGSSSTAAASASATATYPGDSNEHVLRKMQEGSQRKGSRFYNKRALQEEAGVL